MAQNSGKKSFYSHIYSAAYNVSRSKVRKGYVHTTTKGLRATSDTSSRSPESAASLRRPAFFLSTAAKKEQRGKNCKYDRCYFHRNSTYSWYWMSVLYHPRILHLQMILTLTGLKASITHVLQIYYLPFRKNL